jgi:uncharacterized integral membrane protein (TIGR00698 family)
MNVKDLFFSQEAQWRAEDIAPVAVESAPGLVVAAVLGTVAFMAANLKKYGLPEFELMKYIDPLVLAIVLGMLVRATIGKTKVLTKLLPGIILAPYLFIPIGIILYGTQLRFDKMGEIHPSTFLWLIVTMGFSFAAIFISATKIFKTSAPLANLLAAGSAVCGASAIAVVSPVVDAEPDELGAALITNTLLVIASLFTLKAITALVSPELFATTAGALLQQTGFVHMAVPKGPLQDLAMLLKTTRVALLVVIVPTIYYILHKRLFFPWYMVLFVMVGCLYSTTHLPSSITDAIKVIFGIIFTTGLASIGLNANILSAGKSVVKSFAATYVAFVLAGALFLTLETFLH